MTAIKKDLYVEQGATFYWTFLVREGALDVDGNVVPGDPKDLTGCTFRMQIRKTQGDTIIFEADNATDSPAGTGESGFIFGVEPDEADSATPVLTNGYVRLRITDDDTDLFTRKTAKYDVEMEESDGRVVRLYQGQVTTDPNITQVLPEDPPVED